MPIQTRGDRNGDSRAEDRGLLPLGSDCTGEIGLRVSCQPRGRLPGAPEPEYTRRAKTAKLEPSGKAECFS